jgi:hypothetical protein
MDKIMLYRYMRNRRNWSTHSKTYDPNIARIGKAAGRYLRLATAGNDIMLPLSFSEVRDVFCSTLKNMAQIDLVLNIQCSDKWLRESSGCGAADILALRELKNDYEARRYGLMRSINALSHAEHLHIIPRV